MEVVTGSYTGTGASNPISGLGFSPTVVWTVRHTTGRQYWRTTSSGLTGTISMDSNTGSIAAQGITSLDVDGFTLGTDANVNASGATYRYAALKAHASVLAVGTYVGNGIDNTNINGIGFQPDFVWVQIRTASGGPGVFWLSSPGGDNVWLLNGQANPGSNAIQDVHSDGFQVGTDATVNTNGTNYEYVCLKSATNNVYVSSYSGTGGDNLNIVQGNAFAPIILWIHRATTITATAHRTTAYSGDLSNLLGTGTGAVVNIIQAFNADGFQVGTSNHVNVSGATFHYLSMKSLAAPPADLGFPVPMSYPDMISHYFIPEMRASGAS